MTVTWFDDLLVTAEEDEIFPLPSDEDWHWYMEMVYVDPAER